MRATIRSGDIRDRTLTLSDIAPNYERNFKFREVTAPSHKARVR